MFPLAVPDPARRFLVDHSFINWLLSSPVKTGKVSIEHLTGFAVALCIVLPLLPFVWDLIKWVLKGRVGPMPAPETGWVFDKIRGGISSPVKAAMTVCAFLVRDAIVANYTLGRRQVIRQYWLHFVGALVVSFLVYLLAAGLIMLMAGVDLATLDRLLAGDWNVRWKVFSEFTARNPYLSGFAMTLFAYAVFGYAQTEFLEGKFNHLKRIGVRTTIPMAEWDEASKLDIPTKESIELARTTVQQILSRRSVEYVRAKLASGYDAFGPNGYLLDLVARPNVSWRILLMNPDDAGAMRRAEAYLSARASDPPTKTAKEYLDGIREVLKNLKHIKETSNPNIEIHLFNHAPQWRMFLSTGYALVSGFGPGQRSDRAPMVLFENTSTSLFHGYAEMFEDIWHSSSSVFCDGCSEKCAGRDREHANAETEACPVA